MEVPFLWDASILTQIDRITLHRQTEACAISLLCVIFNNRKELYAHGKNLFFSV
jgi:hypothetical protein